MKVRIELDDSVNEAEITIKVSKISDKILQLQQYLQNRDFESIFYKNQQEYYFELSNILFFEFMIIKYMHIRSKRYMKLNINYMNLKKIYQIILCGFRSQEF